MSISGISNVSSLQVQRLVDLRTQLDDLQRQLGSGQKANTYAGLGVDNSLAIGLRNQLSTLTGFSDTSTVLDGRLKLAQTALTNIDSTVHSVQGTMATSTYVIDQTGQTNDQQNAYNQFDAILNALSSQFGDQYIFSGLASNTPPVDTADHIMNGNGNQAGLKQVIAERNQADLGADGLGRLVIPAPTSAAASITGAGATLAPDAPAAVTGGTSLASPPFASAGGTLVVNGVSVTVSPGDTGTDIRDAINTAMTAAAAPAAPQVTASINGTGNLVLTSADADTPVTIGNTSTGSLLTELGVSTGTTDPTNLLTQAPAPVTSGQTLSITLGSGGTPLTVVFGNGPGQVSTLAGLNAALAGMSDATASVDPATGNISISSSYPITIGGTAAAANFGLTTTSAAPVDQVSVSEDVAGSVFGFKLAAATTSIAGASVAGPAGSPPAITVDLAGNQPAAGDTVKFTFTLPDGTSEVLSLTATTSATPGNNEFTIGADPSATLANLQTALTNGVSTLAQTSLAAASALKASNDFFNVDATHPPLRVNGPPATATSLIAGTSANTVMWYQGDAGSTPARQTAVTGVDTSISVSYGMRANEQAFANPIASIAALAAMTFQANDPNGAQRYAAMTERVQANLSTTQGVQTVTDVEADIAGAQTSLAAANDRHTQTTASLQDLLSNVQDASMEQVTAQILQLQTNLQASLQTTALLAKLSLVNYITG